MKLFKFLLLFLVAGCSTQPAPPLVPGQPIAITTWSPAVEIGDGQD
jgi:uncharacterized protein YcfL